MIKGGRSTEFQPLEGAGRGGAGHQLAAAAVARVIHFDWVRSNLQSDINSPESALSFYGRTEGGAATNCLSVCLSEGITVLLSLTVFMLLVAEIMPATSDSVPLIGRWLKPPCTPGRSAKSLR